MRFQGVSGVMCGRGCMRMLLGLVGMAVLGSCATRPRIVSTSIAQIGNEDGEVEVEGIGSALNRAGRENGAVHLFLVHGMGNHPFGDESEFDRFRHAGVRIQSYHAMMDAVSEPGFRAGNHEAFIDVIRSEQFNPLVDRVVNELEMVRRDAETQLEWYEDRLGLLGYRLSQTFASPVWKADLVVHLVAWAPVTIPTKLAIRDGDFYPERDAFFVNKALKDSIVTWGLSDAAQYVGSNGSRMRLAVARSLEGMVRETGIDRSARRRTTPDHFIFGAASLGSIVTLDALSEIASRGRVECPRSGGCVELDPGVVDAMFRGRQPMYMFANQVPLLASAMRSERSSPTEVEALQRLAESVDAEKVEREITVVAFNDPADLLGYTVPKYQRRGEVKVTIVNAMTRNRAWGIWGVVTNPLDSHGGFMSNRAVARIMLEGAVVGN